MKSFPKEKSFIFSDLFSLLFVVVWFIAVGALFWQLSAACGFCKSFLVAVFYESKKGAVEIYCGYDYLFAKYFCF